MRLPNLPRGDLRSIYLHWTGADYVTTFPAYHYCVVFDGGVPAIRSTHDLRANMRALRADEPDAYAAHTAGRNSYAIGIALCGMRDALPQDFGAFSLREDCIDAACALAARLAAFYAISLEAVRTHAEAAVEDGYFGCGAAERWDIARLRQASGPLVAGEARMAGDALRSRIRAHAVGSDVRVRT